jgi:hypothetical protein
MVLVPRRSSASPSDDHAAARVAATCAAALLIGVLQAGPAAADVARVTAAEPDASSRPLEPGAPTQPTAVRVTTTTAAGDTRRLGPFPLEDAPSGLRASPDGRHLLLLPPTDGNGDGTTYVLTLDGSATATPRPLVTPTGVQVAPPYSQLSWTPDGSEVVVGDAARTTPRPGADPDDEDAEQLDWTSLRCPVTTLVCAETAGPRGSAVGVPGGAVVSSSYLSVLPTEYTLRGLSDTPDPEWASPTSAFGRLIRSVNDEVRVSETRLDGTTSRTLGRFEGPASKGLPFTLGIVGGASGALLMRFTTTTRIETRKGRIRIRTRDTGPRLMTVAADGTTRTGPVPRVRVARRDLRRVLSKLPPGPQRLRFVPVLGRPDGGWLGFAADDPGPLDVDGQALATLGEDGRARVVRVRGRAATVLRILESVPGNGRVRAIVGTRLVGYERASRSAVVRVDWEQRRPGRRGAGRRRDTTIRVPVDGTGRPGVVPGGADAAW